MPVPLGLIGVLNSPAQDNAFIDDFEQPAPNGWNVFQTAGGGNGASFTRISNNPYSGSYCYEFYNGGQTPVFSLLDALAYAKKIYDLTGYTTLTIHVRGDSGLELYIGVWEENDSISSDPAIVKVSQTLGSTWSTVSIDISGITGDKTLGMYFEGKEESAFIDLLKFQ